MKFGDDEYLAIVKLAKFLNCRDAIALTVANEEIERLQAESQANYDAADKWEECALKQLETVSDLDDDKDRLCEELKLSEAKRAELLRLLRNTKNFASENHEAAKAEGMHRVADGFLCLQSQVVEALASQPRPKILAVLEAAIKVKAEYDAVPLSARRYAGKNEDELFAAVAAMKEA